MVTTAAARPVAPAVRAWAVVVLIIALVVEPAVLFGAYAVWLAARAPADVPRALAVSATLGLAGVAGIRAAVHRPAAHPILLIGLTPALVALLVAVST